MKKRQRRTIGSLVKVPVDDFFVYAQILQETDMVFFDSKGKDNLSEMDIINLPVLFRVSANDDAIIDGRWSKVGKTEISSNFSQPVPRFIQDALNPEKYEIYLGGDIRPASKDECKNLDRCAVWAVNHIEDRIRDYYNNVPNVWVEQMSFK